MWSYVSTWHVQTVVLHILCAIPIESDLITQTNLGRGSGAAGGQAGAGRACRNMSARAFISIGGGTFWEHTSASCTAA